MNFFNQLSAFWSRYFISSGGILSGLCASPHLRLAIVSLNSAVVISVERSLPEHRKEIKTAQCLFSLIWHPLCQYLNDDSLLFIRGREPNLRGQRPQYSWYSRYVRKTLVSPTLAQSQF